MAILLATAGTLAAQVASGTVTDSASHQPIPGAVVTLLGADAAVLGQTITDELGAFRLAYSRSAKSLRVVRIGFQPRSIPLDEAASGADQSFNIVMGPFSATLTTVRVSAQANCPVSDDRSAALAFWDQARAGLLNTVVARKAHPMAVHRYYFQTSFSATNDTIKRFVIYEDSSSSVETSFTVARSARDLVRLGFAGDPGVVVGYMFGPDADVLLDDAFANGYCFRLAAPSAGRSAQVGLSFAAADSKRNRVDIAGTLWVDTAARALHDVEFRYVGMPGVAEQFHPGGTISFATTANGVAFIDRWSLRLIGNAPDTVYTLASCPTSCRSITDHFYPTENGAEVSHAIWRGGLRWDAQLGTVSVSATTGGRPAAGIVVRLAGTPYHGTTDATGALKISELLPGPYALKVGDERAATLGIFLPTSARFTAVRDSTIRLSLDVPTVEEYVTSQCRANKRWTASDSTFLLGRVVDKHGNPVAGARVTFAAREAQGTWTWDLTALTTDTDGVFASCSTTLNPGATLQVRVEGDQLLPRSLTRPIATKTSIVSIQMEPRP